jgi:predicted metalloprotease
MTIYIDETFFTELQQRFKAQGGDVAEAYVIAHEVGHHVQNQLGIMDQVQQQGSSNEQSVRLELQADCFAGIWANSVADLGIFEAGEINEAIDAASAVGDDRIQQSVQGQITPETWTHGSSEQRVEWFTNGYENGSPQSCNTF